jgi:hypothetical protein
MKQTRDDVIREENGALLVDINGLPIPFEVANRKYRDQLSLIIEQALSPRLLGLLERSSKLSRDFVQSRLLWMKLFRKHFPVEYNHVTDKDGNMHPLIKLKLDAISQQPGRTETYWKRYYEWLFKSRPAFDAYYEMLRERQSGTYAEIKISNWQGDGGPHLFSTPKLKHWLRPLAPDADYIIRRHPDNPVEEVYIIYPNVPNYNGLMLRIATKNIVKLTRLQNGQIKAHEGLDKSVTVIEYDERMTTGDLIYTLTPGSFDVMWRSLDGLSLYYIRSYDKFYIAMFIPKRQEQRDRRFLVSCVVCSEPSNTQCSHCDEIYCSVNCQATTH